MKVSTGTRSCRHITGSERGIEIRAGVPCRSLLCLCSYFALPFSSTLTVAHCYAATPRKGAGACSLLGAPVAIHRLVNTMIGDH